MNIFIRSDMKFDIEPTTTVKELKDFLISNDFDFKTTTFTFSNGKQLSPIVFQTNQYDNVDFMRYGNYLKGSSLVVSKIPVLQPVKQTQYMDLPSEMLIETVDPSEALVLLKTVKYNNWKKLLDINYDFVTQGFAVGDTNEEKFKYLAERVSKNIDNENPEIIFTHFNGKPLGEKRFLEFHNFIGSIEDEDFDYGDSYDDNKLIWKSFIDGIKQSGTTEWVRYDDNNAWIKVIDSYKLPTSFKTGTRRIIRDVDIYDYPETRRLKIQIESGMDYPGTVNITKEKVLKLPEVLMSIDPEYPIDDMLTDWIFDGGYTTKEYGVYYLMLNLGLDRTDSELVVKILTNASITSNFSNFMEHYKNYIIVLNYK